MGIIYKSSVLTDKDLTDAKPLQLDFDGDTLELKNVYKAKARVKIEREPTIFGDFMHLTTSVNGIEFHGSTSISNWNDLQKGEMNMVLVFAPLQYDGPNKCVAQFLYAESIEDENDNG